MIKPKEILKAYASTAQRELLIKFFSQKFFRDNFFLTGGTALAVFYFGHRKSKDLDLFLREELNLLEYVNLFRSLSSVKRVISESPCFCSYIYNEDIKVDLVFERFSKGSKKKRVLVEDIIINLENLKNICINKISEVLSRAEPKDIVDLTLLFNEVFNAERDFISLYKEAIRREVLLEGYLYAAGLFDYIVINSEEILSPIRKSLLKELTSENIKRVFTVFERQIREMAQNLW